jgi:hypothetical protein
VGVGYLSGLLRPRTSELAALQLSRTSRADSWRNRGRSTHAYITSGGNTAQEVDRCSTERRQNRGAQTNAAAENCPNCGVRVITTPQTNVQEKKNPRIAAVASVILPGLGQIYTEQTRKAIALIVVAVLLLYAIVAYRNITSELADFLYIVILVYSAYDAYNMAKLINLGDA